MNAASLSAAPIGTARDGRQVPAMLCWMAAAILPLHLSMFRFVVGSIIVRPADLVALAVLAGTALTVPGWQRHFLRRDVALLGMACVYIVLQGHYLHNVPASLKEATQLALAVLTVIVMGVHIERAPRRFQVAFMVALALSAGYTLLVHLMLGQFVRYKLAGDGRYIFGLLSLTLLLAARHDGWRLSGLLLFGLSVVPLVASLERKGLLGVLVVLLAFAFTRAARMLRVHAGVMLALLAACLLPLGLAVVPYALDELRQAVADNHFLDEARAAYTSNLHRTALLLNGADLFSHHWLFGTGADTLRVALRWYFDDWHMAIGTHNFYLDNLIKYGVVGAGLLFAAMAAGVRAALRSLAQGSPHAYLAAYLYFVVTFMSEGTAVTVMALLPAFTGGLFSTRSAEAGDTPADHQETRWIQR